MAAKVKDAQAKPNGSSAEHLTHKEYRVIASTAGFPKLPVQANNITYDLWYDGVLPDYLLTITYDLPLEIEVDTIDYYKGGYTKSQRFEVLDSIKRVTYSEGEH